MNHKTSTPGTHNRFTNQWRRFIYVRPFDFTDGGDTIIFSNNPNLTSADDLTITADGDDIRIRYGSNSTVTLKDTSLNDVDASHFQFDPAGLISSDDFLV